MLQYMVSYRHYFVCCETRIQLEKAEEGKVAEYSALSDRIRFQSIVVETSGKKCIDIQVLLPPKNS